MATHDVKFRLVGQDAGAGRVLADVAKKSDAAHSSFRSLSGVMGGLGGPFSLVTEAAEKVGLAFEHVHENGKRLTTVLQGAGIGMAAIGAGLVQFSAKQDQARAQLKTSIEETGNSYADFRTQIEETIKAQARFGHDDADVQEALNKLTLGLQSPTKAIEEMGLASNIAAVKHISLADAADLLVRAHAGSTRVFKQFGIEITGTKITTQQTDAALRELAVRLNGQASSASDTFSGKLRALRTEGENLIASLGHYGPVLMAVGSGLTIVTTAMDLLAARKARQLALDTQLIARETELAAVERTEGAAALTAGEEGAAGMAARGAAGAGAAGVAAKAGKGAFGLGVVGGIAAVGMGAIPDRLSQADKQTAIIKALEKNGDKAKLREAVTELKHVENSVKGNREWTAKWAAAVNEMAANATKAGAASDKVAEGVKKVGAAASITEKDVTGMVNALNSYVSARGNDQATLDGFMKSINDLGDAVKNNGSKALDGYTDAAIANREALRNLAGQELARIDILRKHGATSARARAEAIKMSTALEDQATKVFGDKAAVDKFLGALHLLPSQVKTDIKLTGVDAAISAAKSVADQIRAIPAGKTIVLTTTGGGDQAAISAGQRGRRVAKAAGGPITGGILGRDSVPAMLMPGEYVVRSDGSNLDQAAAYYGRHNQQRSGTIRLHPFDLDALVSGLAEANSRQQIVTDRSRLDRRGGRAVMAAL